MTGAFDYGSVLRRVVTQLTNSGLRKIEYGSGYASRVEVAARRAVMTGVANLTGEIADYNAKKLGTEYFELNGMPEHDLRIRYGKDVSGQRSSCIRSVDLVP